MKKSLLFFFLMVFLSSSDSYSQINDFVSYYPLQVGNKWVYSFYNTQFGQSGRLSRQINSYIETNGHKYYYYNSYYQRVDSFNANVYNYFMNNGCQWSTNERMKDSLSSRLNDTVRYDCGTNYKICSDTNMQILFSNMTRAKNFRLGNNGIIYAKNFGVMEFYTQNGNVYYVEHLIGCIINGIVYGDTSLVGIHPISNEIPSQFQLYQNYPNPFNPTTRLRWALPSVVQTFLSVYDNLGREVASLINEKLQPGTYETEWNASNYPSGVYYYKISAGDYTETRKMVLVK